MSEVGHQANPLLERSHRGQLQFLTFQLASDTQAMVSATHLTEVLTLPTQAVIPIPDMPEWVLGIYNWRGEILWVIDLALFLSLDSETRGTQRTLLITQTHQHRLGLMVCEVDDMLWCDSDQIVSPPASAVTMALAPVLKGYTLSSTGEMLLALDTEAIQRQAYQRSDLQAT